MVLHVVLQLRTSEDNSRASGVIDGEVGRSTLKIRAGANPLDGHLATTHSDRTLETPSAPAEV